MHSLVIQKLEKEWYDKLRSIGMDHTDATLLSRLKAQMTVDTGLRIKIGQEGFHGFCDWVRIHCLDIYYTIRDVLNSVWEKIKSYF